MPTMIVAPMPIGSGPGMARRPRAPTNKPLITRRMRYVIMAIRLPGSPGQEPLQHVAGAHDIGEFAVQAGRGGATRAAGGRGGAAHACGAATIWRPAAAMSNVWVASITKRTP